MVITQRTALSIDAVRVDASFRDPSGFVFQRDGVLFRQVNESYRDSYDLLTSSGLLASLTADELLVSHREEEFAEPFSPGAYRILRPERIPQISYPYCWCFGQLKDAALLTLEVQRRAILHGMTLKDASAFNVQWRGSAPILIDTLSLERREPGLPWLAYRQFCQHFLAPLLLMSSVDPRLGRLFRSHLDGVPLDVASKTLPASSWLRFSTLLHVHLHARSLRRFANTKLRESKLNRPISTNALSGLVESLSGAVRRLRWLPSTTEWAAYEEEHAYSLGAYDSKRALVDEWLRRIRPASVWDLGANTGTFSRIAADAGAQVLALDSDDGAVEMHYRRLRDAGERNILPLVVDLANPSPALGWANREWQSLESRGPADALLALALVHHLAITNGIPLGSIASWFARLGAVLVIEFVPKEDPQVQRLLGSRRDIFDQYTLAGFELAFAPFFNIVRSEQLGDSGRTLLLLERR